MAHIARCLMSLCHLSLVTFWRRSRVCFTALSRKRGGLLNFGAYAMPRFDGSMIFLNLCIAFGKRETTSCDERNDELR